MHRTDGGQQHARITTAIETALQVLAVHDSERAGQLERALRNPDGLEATFALRESLAEALFEHNQDETAMEVLCA
jgi:hypothetical protein